MWLIVLFLAPVLFVVLFELYFFKYKRIINRFPGPMALPVLGNAPQMGKTPSDILSNLFLWWHKYNNGNYRLWIGFYAYIMVSNPKDVEFILTSNTMLEKADIYDMLHPWLGRGLLTSFGSHWHKHRKMITPSFHFKILQIFHEVMNTNSTKFISKLRKAADGDTIFDFQDMVHYLTLDVICETAMGVNINAMDSHDSAVVTAFKDMCYNINMRAFHPLKRKNALYRFSSDYPEYRRTLKVLEDFTKDIIQKRIEARKNIETNRMTTDMESDEFIRNKLAFLDTLLSATIDGEPLSQQDVYEEVSTFMFEGHDTTTSGIAFAIYMLSRHPEIQKKAYGEQQLIMGFNLKRDATFQEIADMKYLDLVLKEAQRLYPSVPIVGRCADKDYDMNGSLLPKGATVNILLIALGYNEQTFPDPYRCKPERFDMDQRTEKLNPFAYVPFSAGPRNCIGQKFALLEVKTIVSKIVRNFEILPPLDELINNDGYVQNFLGLSMEEQLTRNPNPNKYDPVLSTVLTLKSENGIHIRLRERN